MSLLGLLFLLAAHYFSGRGLLSFFHLKMHPAMRAALAFITGVMVLSFIPFLLQLAHIPITFATVFAGIFITVFILNVRSLKKIKNFSLKNMRIRFPSFRVYEVPFMIFFGIMLFAGAWRTFYFPPNARDMLAGPETIAEYTVREHSMINSVLSINLETTNNHQKPPFITCLQIIYKLFGFPFGQIWLSILAIAFSVFLYKALSEKLHPVIACSLLLLFFAIPELYAYSFIMLFDYSNMILFFLGFYFMLQYFLSGFKNNFYFAAFLFGFATYIRLETVILIALFIPAFWIYAFRKKLIIKNVALQSFILMAIPAVIYFLWVNIFLKYYMPVQFHLNDSLTTNYFDLGPLWKRFSDMNTILIFGEKYGKSLWGYFIQIFFVLTIADLIIVRKVGRETRHWFYAIAIVYFGLPLLGYLIPIMDLLNTTKRGLFKMMPLMLMVLANNGLLQKISSSVIKWESEVAMEVDKKHLFNQKKLTQKRKK